MSLESFEPEVLPNPNLPEELTITTEHNLLLREALKHEEGTDVYIEGMLNYWRVVQNANKRNNLPKLKIMLLELKVNQGRKRHGDANVHR